MEQRELGTTGIRVSTVALGCMSIVHNGTYDGIAVDQAIATIHAALDAGINFFDTAPAYGDGKSEEILGQALQDRRDRAVIATKASNDTLSYDAVVSECETSLRLLRTDRIDLYQIHWPRRVVPMEETVRALEDLQRSGKVRAVGVCNFGPTDLSEFVSLTSCVTNQIVYSLLARAVEFEVRGLCLEYGVGLLCYSPLAQGLLTGRFRCADDVPVGRARTRHFRGDRPQVRHGEPGCEEETFAAIEDIRAISQEVGCSMSALAIAWLIHQKAVTSVLAGASTPDQVRANAAAASVRLSDDVLDRLDDATRPVMLRMGASLDMWDGTSRVR